MKKSLWIAIAGALAVSVVAASAQEVLSANTIGYIKKQLPAEGKLITVSVPLISMTAANNIFSNLSLAAEAPAGSVVSFWDPVTQGWFGGTKSGKPAVWPINVRTQIVGSGEFFFLKGPTTNLVPTEITIAGEVPTEATLARTIPGSANLGSVANPYPADFVFGTSPLASNAAAGSVVSFWNPVAQVWFGGTKSGKPAVWPSNVLTQRVVATEGFFLKVTNTTGMVWTNSKPYTWP